MRSARRDHRQAVLSLGHAAIENDRAIIIDHFLDFRVELFWIITDQTQGAIGFCQFDEVRQALGIGMRVALAMQQFLPLANHAHPFIVQDENLDREVVLYGGRYFLQHHLYRRLASNIDH